MSKKQYGLFLMLAIVSGLVGGEISSMLRKGTSVAGKAITVEEVRIVDKNGRVQALLGTSSCNDKPCLQFVDPENGKALVSLGALDGEAGGGWLTLYSKERKTSVDLYTFAEQPQLKFNGKGKHVSIGLPSGYPLVGCTIGDVTAELGVSVDDLSEVPSAHLILRSTQAISTDKKLKFEQMLEQMNRRSTGVDIQLSESEEPQIRLYKGGVTRAVLGNTELISGAGSVEKLPPSSLVLLGENGRVVWRAP
jgi:hypothetical protein